MKDPVFVYKSPGKQYWCGCSFDSKVVERSELEKMYAEGWKSSPQEAHAATSQEEEKVENARECSDQEIYEMAALGKSWAEIKEESGNGAPHLAAKRWAKANDLVYPPKPE